MAKVNFRMILLAVLALGITAIGALLSPQLNVTQKVFMLLFLIMIPPIFWLLEKMHNVKVRKTAERKFREIERNNLLKDLESIESNIKSIKSSPLLQESAEVYLRVRELETMRESIQRRLKEIDK